MTRDKRTTANSYYEKRRNYPFTRPITGTERGRVSVTTLRRSEAGRQGEGRSKGGRGSRVWVGGGKHQAVFGGHGRGSRLGFIELEAR